MSLEIVPCGTSITIPASCAVCPLCGAGLTVDIDEWEHAEDGLWQATAGGVYVSCVTEPDEESADWPGWMQAHFALPAVDWVPVERRVTRWLRQHVRFTRATC